MKSSIMVISLVLAFGLTVAANASAESAPAAGLLSTAGSKIAPEEVVLASALTGLEWTDNPAETLHYDGGNANAIGLTSGGTYRGAVRFTPTFKCTVKAVLFYQRDASSNDYIFIFGEDNDTTPGSIVDSFPYTGSGSMRWKWIDLTRPLVATAGTDFWACVRVTHDSAKFPLGVDSGPMIRNRGGFIATGASGGHWQQLPDLNPQLNYNWNIRAIVEPVSGLAHDVGVSRILSPGTGITPGSYTPKARIVNFGETAESDIPVTCQIDSSGTLVYNQTTTYPGPLAPGHRTEVTFSPDWNTGPSGNSYTVSMFTALGSDMDRSNDTTSQITNIMAGQVVMDHDTGYCKLTVTCLGSIGYTEPPSYSGSGFCYPKTSASHLFYSSLMLGNSQSYLVDRFYNQPANSGVNTDFRIVDSLHAIVPPGSGDEHFRCIMNDAGHTSPKDLKITQNSYMCADPGYDDFVILVYDIQNHGSNATNGLYAGVVSDFDVGTDPRKDDVHSDTVRRAVWMRYYTSANPTIGLVVLDPPHFAGLAGINHRYYIYPDSCVTDGQKYRMLNGAIGDRNSTESYDWSLVASFGPFDLPAGAKQRVAFAVVGGISEANFKVNADSAQSWYNTQVGLAENPNQPRAGRWFEIVPNPFRKGTFIHYFSSTPGRLEIKAYDASGRLKEETGREITTGNGIYHWQPKNLARGVYFLKVNTPDKETVTKVLLLN